MPQNYAKIAKTTPFLVFLRRLKQRQLSIMVSRIRISSLSNGSRPVNGSIIIKVVIGNESPLTKSKAEDLFGKRSLLIRDNHRNVWTATVNWMFGDSCRFQRGSEQRDSNAHTNKSDATDGVVDNGSFMNCLWDLTPRICEGERQGMLKPSKQTTSVCSELTTVVSRSLCCN